MRENMRTHIVSFQQTYIDVTGETLYATVYTRQTKLCKFGPTSKQNSDETFDFGASSNRKSCGVVYVMSNKDLKL